MTRKILLYLTAFFAIGIYFLAGNRVFMNWFTNTLETNRSGYFRWDKYKYGDLYGLSYIPKFKRLQPVFASQVTRVPDHPKENDLWIIGDSYLSQMNAEMADSAFYRTALKYCYLPDAESGNAKPVFFQENGRKRILLIERTERYLRKDFATRESALRYISFFYVEPSPLPAENRAEVQKIPANTPGKSTFTSILKGFRIRAPMPVMNQNLETMLCAYSFFSPVKEWKADLNFKLFNHVSSQVYLAPDKQNLYAFETIDPHGILSAFKPIDNMEIDSIAINLNFVADYYKKQGFDKIIISVIPNAVSVGDPQIGNYNHILEKVQNSGKVSFPFLNIYPVYLNHPDRKTLYSISDTHWTPAGFKIWTDQLNSMLEYEEKKQ